MGSTLIIGSSAAGLACAVCLKKQGKSFVLLERSNRIGNEWRNRYDRLHLHTPKKYSSLPFFRLPGEYGQYVSKNDFADYLETYARKFGIEPVFNQNVDRLERAGNSWCVHSANNHWEADNVIVATGFAREPIMPAWKGMQLFSGDILHSSSYKNGLDFQDKKVLVVGFGNSGCEIGLCLYEHGAHPAFSVRDKINILPRDIAGIPVISIAIAERWLTRISPRLTDAINRPLLRLVIGNPTRYGLKLQSYGPLTQIVKHKKIPLLDVGTMKLIREGRIPVFPGIEELSGNQVRFTDGRTENFDAIIAATGFRPALQKFLAKIPGSLDENGLPLKSGQQPAAPGLYFCGFHVSPYGMLREIGLEARRIASQIAP